MHFLGWAESLLEHHKGWDHFATELVEAANHTRLRPCGMGEKRGLHVNGADAVPGNLNHLVGAAGEPDVVGPTFGALDDTNHCDQ